MWKKERLEDPRKVKVRTPWALLVAWVCGCLFLVAGMIYGLGSFQRDFAIARMAGIVTVKRFEERESEREITFGRGGVAKRDVAGEYVLTVLAAGRDGVKREFTVWVSEALYRKTEVGSVFDVGPYLVPESAQGQ